MHRSVLMYNLAQCLRRTGNTRAAIVKYQEVSEIDGRMPEYHMELAQCYLEIDQPAEAVEALLRAQSLGPSISEVYSLLGFAYLSAKDSDKAVSAYGSAHRLVPDDPALAYDYAYVLSEVGRGREALRTLASVDTRFLDPELAKDVATLRAEQLAASGNIAAARAELLMILERLPGDEDLKENLGILQVDDLPVSGEEPAT